MGDELFDSYFIGGEWDGVRKRTNGDRIIKVIKTNGIHEKYKTMLESEGNVVANIELEEDIYVMFYQFIDGVSVYRLGKDIGSAGGNIR